MFQAKPLKMLNTNTIFFLLLLEIRSTFSEALRQVKKQQCKVKFWKWGPTTIWHNMESVTFFSLSQITPPYSPVMH